MRKFLAILTAITLLASLLAGCGGSDLTVSVQSVGMLTGLGSVGAYDRFAGVVESGETVNVDRNEQMELGETKVKAGDVVKQGDVLFTYNTETLSLDLEKLQLELEQLKSGISTKKDQIKELEKEKKEASKDDQLEYTLQIQTLEVDVKEAEYSVTAKQKEIDRTKETLKDSSVVTPVDGTIKSVNSDGGVDQMGNPKSYIVITQSGDFRIKGVLNELSSLSEGAAVLIHSRADDSTWRGTVSKIDRENPTQGSGMGMMYTSSYYGGSSDEMSSTSNYPFYVELESSENLMLGQHVYIEPDQGQGEKEGFHLSAYYIASADSDPYVWAANKNDKLEKRSITLGDYDEALDEYEVIGGLELSDYIADPNEPCEEGASVTYYDENSFGGANNGGEPAAPIGGEDIVPEGEDLISEGDTPIDGAIVPEGEIIPYDTFEDIAGAVDTGVTEGSTAPEVPLEAVPAR